MAGVGPAHRLRRGVVQLKEAGLFEGGWILEKTLVWALVSIAALLPGDKVTTRSAGAAAATTEDWSKVLNKWFKDRGSLLRMRIQLTISKDLKYREWLWRDTADVTPEMSATEVLRDHKTLFAEGGARSEQLKSVVEAVTATRRAYFKAPAATPIPSAAPSTAAATTLLATPSPAMKRMFHDVVSPNPPMRRKLLKKLDKKMDKSVDDLLREARELRAELKHSRRMRRQLMRRMQFYRDTTKGLMVEGKKNLTVLDLYKKSTGILMEHGRRNSVRHLMETLADGRLHPEEYAADDVENAVHNGWRKGVGKTAMGSRWTETSKLAAASMASMRSAGGATARRSDNGIGPSANCWKAHTAKTRLPDTGKDGVHTAGVPHHFTHVAGMHGLRSGSKTMYDAPEAPAASVTQLQYPTRLFVTAASGVIDGFKPALDFVQQARASAADGLRTLKGELPRGWTTKPGELLNQVVYHRADEPVPGQPSTALLRQRQAEIDSATLARNVTALRQRYAKEDVAAAIASSALAPVGTVERPTQPTTAFSLDLAWGDIYSRYYRL